MHLLEHILEPLNIIIIMLVVGLIVFFGRQVAERMGWNYRWLKHSLALLLSCIPFWLMVQTEGYSATALALLVSHVIIIYLGVFVMELLTRWDLHDLPNEEDHSMLERDQLRGLNSKKRIKNG